MPAVSKFMDFPKFLSCAALLCAAAKLHSSDVAVDYAKAGYPFIEKHCIECHGEKVKKSGVSLIQYKDEATVAKDRTLWKMALTMVLSGEMPPEKKPRPTPAEIDVFARSVGGVFERGDRDSKTSAGHVAMRRLNRTEYNNTVRDLLDIDFNASEDFPADEVGHGFDNISDVQWISAAHMERFLAAAEAVAQRAVAVEFAKPPLHQQGGPYLEPASPQVPKDKFRLISGEKPADAVSTGPLHTPYKMAADGRYIFRAKMYGTVEAGKTVRVALLGCGKNVPKPASDADAATLFGAAVKNLRPFQILEIVEIKARTEKDAQKLEIKLPAGFVMERGALAIVKPPEGEPIPKVFVEYLSLEGPLDTRPPFQRKSLDRPAEKPTDVFTREFLPRFVSKAFRRPARQEEVSRYINAIEEAEAHGEQWETGLRQVIQAILVSPKFLFRPELESQSASPGLQPLGEYELASRLSYFLWSSMPDEELFALAEKKTLGANLEAQVRRMLKDPKSRALTDNFAMQWLQLRRLNNFNPDAKLFPKFNAQLKSAMLEESALFIDAIIREDRSILDIIDGNFTYLNEALAQHYRIADTHGNRAGQKGVKNPGEPIKGNDFVRVELSDPERGGLLTQASVLAVTSNPTRTSPVKRGKWVLDQLLGTPPPPPPPDIPSLEKEELKGTMRERLEQHRANPSCANCHARMDPIGFAFENYDSTGAFRTQDGGKPIDASGALPNGQAFAGATELKAILKKKKDLFSRCVSEKMLTYAIGRGVEVYDNQSVERIMEVLAKDNYRFSTLAIEIVKSEPFRMRKGQ